jgi:hypothetical protein
MPMPRKPRNACLNCEKECRKASNIYCNRSCQQEYQRNKFLERWKNGEENGYWFGGQLSGVIRNYLIKTRGAKCEICGWCEINPITGKVPINIDHTDGDYRNCHENNLRILCPNHHALTPTFGGLNRGHGRTMRYKK